MKRLFLLSIIMVFVITSTTVYAAEKAPLGIGNIALKLDYINFTDEDLEDLDAETGLYLGLEGYGEIAPNIYLGAEIGYANPEGDIHVYIPFYGLVKVDTEVTFVPIELNLKYAFDAAPNFVVDLGAGASYNYAKGELTVDGISDDEDDWLFGGQVFADLNYRSGAFFLGINAKYQITEDLEIKDIGYKLSGNNWRIGGQIGIVF